MHKNGIITVLPFSKYANPIFAQSKRNGKLDLRKNSTLIADGYTNNFHPVSTLSDAAQHLAGKLLFYKLYCSQAYHCLQMADQLSVEMHAFNFASRSFAYRTLSQGLSRFLSAFSSFMRKYFDPVVKAVNVLNTWKRLELQSIMPGTLPGTSGQSSSAFARQDWKWELKTPLWSQTKWIPKQNHFIRGIITINWQSSKLPKQNEVPQIEKGFAALTGLRKLL